MLAAAVFDFCDGLAARLLKAYSPIGKELDSLADMVSFGVLPALLVMNCMQEQGVPTWLCYSALFIAVMSAVRLAKFNIDTRQTTDFIGVATPTCALLSAGLASYVAGNPDSFLAAWAGTVWFLPLYSLVMGLLLVSEIPMFGMKVAPGHKLLDAKRIVFLVLAISAIALALIVWKDISLAILLVFSIYLVENLIVYIFHRK
jgi:CDP-diacylglycerol--serine O-phosphatidyltransferase